MHIHVVFVFAHARVENEITSLWCADAIFLHTINQLFSNISVPNQSKCVPITSSQAHHAEKMHVDPLARRNASFAPSSDVWKYITELGISKVGVLAACQLSKVGQISGIVGENNFKMQNLQN